MPTNTPSPHRFLAVNPPASQRAKPRPPSSLRHGVTAQTPQPSAAAVTAHALVGGTQRATPARRFIIPPPASTPRVSHPDDREDEAGPKTQSTPHLKLPGTLQRVESIEEDSQESSPASSGDDCYEISRSQLPEHAHAREQGLDEGEDDDAELLFTTPQNHYKRRRLFPEPPTSRTPAPSSTPGLSAAASVPSRPHFILPSHPLSPVKPTVPLPDTFSPSRKGQKFIPGGLASMLQSWMVETANTGYQSQIKDTVVWGRDKEDGVKVRVTISSVHSGKMSGSELGIGEDVECSPGDVVFVKGDVDAVSLRVCGEEGGVEMDAKVLLAGQGGARGSTRVRLREGDVVGIRAPTWHVEVMGERWMVGVDWVVCEKLDVMSA